MSSLLDGQAKWVDVFVTKPDATDSGGTESLVRTPYGNDDKFVMPVFNIRVATDTAESKKAIVTEDASEWVMCAFPDNAKASGGIYKAVEAEELLAIKVGDLVRIGKASTGGFTDYLTVMEIRKMDSITNGLAVTIPKDASVVTPAWTGNFTLIDLTSGYDTNSGAARIALRLNRQVTCTKIPTDTIPKYTVSATTNTYVSGAAERHFGFAQTYGAYGKVVEHLPYPLYRAVDFAGTKEQQRVLRVRFDRSVKDVKCIKLMAYQFANKAAIDFAHAHEIPVDDYLILRIKEIGGEVVSNNRHAHGAFAVLSAGAIYDAANGGRHYGASDTVNGLVTQTNLSTNQLSSLTLELTNRQGDAAQIGRVHMWFKVLAAHG